MTKYHPASLCCNFRGGALVIGTIATVAAERKPCLSIFRTIPWEIPENHSLHALNRAKHHSEHIRLWKPNGNGTLEIGKQERLWSTDRTLSVLSSAGSNGEEAGRQEGGPEEDSLEKS
jgi:hypothetical protein